MRILQFAGITFLSCLSGPLYAAPLGAIAPLVGDEVRADPRLRYKTVFPITKAASATGKVNPSLDKVARYLNLLQRDGIRSERGDVVVIVSGAATPIVAGSADNPNLALIARLQQAGVTVAVCAQALHGHGIGRKQLATGIRVDLSAMTTLATLQLRGWAVITD